MIAELLNAEALNAQRKMLEFWKARYGHFIHLIWDLTRQGRLDWEYGKYTDGYADTPVNLRWCCLRGPKFVPEGKEEPRSGLLLRDLEDGSFRLAVTLPAFADDHTYTGLVSTKIDATQEELKVLREEIDKYMHAPVPDRLAWMLKSMEGSSPLSFLGF
jgi:hypothetical protein